ncbi:MAG: dNTP triphosphohydrolase [Planctomycetaceae bacterium]|jgi:dGTPase|nr:dNTP triphosphohydrolase [Planctomycetaceae bacterium]
MTGSDRDNKESTEIVLGSGLNSYSYFLSSYAFLTASSVGRRYPEAFHPYRNAFQRDRDRIIHCAAFRRLSEKMQVFASEFGNYHRTRLTHTLEVVCIARTLSRVLGLNEDFVEAAALLHDIGHPPFGHCGESVLDSLLAESGGFDHNLQALRIVEKLERRYVDFPGLNLSREILDGQAYKFTKSKTPFLEIQVVDVADSVAYDTHDVDDAMEVGLLNADQLMQTSLWKHSANRVRGRWANLNEIEFRQAVVHDLIDVQVSDIVIATQKRLIDFGVETVEDVLKLQIIVAPGNEIAEQKNEMELFLLEQVYRHPKVMLFRNRIAGWINRIFEYYIVNTSELPERYESVQKQEGKRRAVADFIADMTDRSVRLYNQAVSKFPKLNT